MARPRANQSDAQQAITPSLIITPDINAETWLGAAGCACGSQTCSGITPAFDPKPMPSRTKTRSRVSGSRCPLPNSIPPNHRSSGLSEKQKPKNSAANPACVITKYTHPALAHPCVHVRSSPRNRMSGHGFPEARNVSTLRASVTRTIAARNRLSATPRPAIECLPTYSRV